jgi:hypothetical protein
MDEIKKLQEEVRYLKNHMVSMKEFLKLEESMKMKFQLLSGTMKNTGPRPEAANKP